MAIRAEWVEAIRLESNNKYNDIKIEANVVGDLKVKKERLLVIRTQRIQDFHSRSIIAAHEHHTHSSSNTLETKGDMNSSR